MNSGPVFFRDRDLSEKFHEILRGGGLTGERYTDPFPREMLNSLPRKLPVLERAARHGVKDISRLTGLLPGGAFAGLYIPRATAEASWLG